MGNVVETHDARGKLIRRWYCVDIKKALDPNADREDAIVSLPEDRVLRTNFNRDVVMDCSTVEKECEHHMFPLMALLETSQRNAWRRAYTKLNDNCGDGRHDLWDTFEEQIVERFTGYLLPIISLKKETPPEAVAQVFEKVNTGGVALTVFELVTAMFSSENFRLREEWRERYRRMTEQPATNALLRGMESSDFLTGVALLSSYRKYLASQGQGNTEDVVKCKRKDVLNLALTDYQAVADDLIEGFIKAAKFLVQHKIFQRRDVPYTTQLVPLAAILTALGEQGAYDSAREKIARWFWCSVFGELYASSVETRFARDLPEVVAWVRGGDKGPSTILNANFASERLYRLRTRNSAAYKGVSALLMNAGGQDFLSGESVELSTFFDERLDIHHIFPQKWCKEHGIERNTYNSIVNKTPLSSRTNRMIGGNAPSDYLKSLERSAEMSPQRLNTILETHLIPPERLRDDDFEGFFKERASALLDLIEKAMGRAISRDEGDPFEVANEDPLDDEVELVWDK